MGDLGDFSKSGSFRNLRGDSIVRELGHIVEKIELKHLWRRMWQIQGPIQVGDVYLSRGQL